MTRLTVLLPLVAACSVGTYGEAPPTGGDAANVEDRDTCVNRNASPNEAHNHAASGAGDTPATAAGPRSGTGCLAAATCHGAGGAGGQFTFAGTAYKELSGVTAAVGATVRIFMPGTKKSLAKAVTDKAGNFYTQATVTFPAGGLEVDITACDSTPSNIIPMVSPVRANEANCSSSDSCHIIPGTRAVYLPGG